MPGWLSGDSNGFVSRLRKDTGVQVPHPAPQQEVKDDSSNIQ